MIAQLVHRAFGESVFVEAAPKPKMAGPEGVWGVIHGSGLPISFRVGRHSGAKARNLNRAVPARLSHSWDNLR
jgi:hypothetical protein